VVEVADEGHLLQDVGLDAGNAVEEEEGEDAGRDAEGGADGAPVRGGGVSWVFPGLRSGGMFVWRFLVGL
jgi:hypothetical protein